MECPRCAKEIVPDRLFCMWCEAFLPKAEAVDHLRSVAQPGDIVMLVGAGDIGDLQHAMAARLSELPAA